MLTRMVVVAAGERLPVEEVEERVVEMYVRDVKQEFETVFVPFLKMCKSSSAKVGSFFYFQSKFRNLKKFQGQTKNSLNYYNLQCQVETLLLEYDDPAKALLRFIYKSGVNSLVMGSFTSNIFTRYYI